MQWRDREAVEPAAIAALVSLEGKRVIDVGYGTVDIVGHATSVCAFDPDSQKVADARASLSRRSAQELIESDQHASAMA
jgi:hypothetical protein